MIEENQITTYTTNDGQVFIEENKAIEHIQTKLVQIFEKHIRSSDNALMGNWETRQAIGKIELAIFSNVESIRAMVKEMYKIVS